MGVSIENARKEMHQFRDMVSKKEEYDGLWGASGEV